VASLRMAAAGLVSCLRTGWIFIRRNALRLLRPTRADNAVRRGLSTAPWSRQLYCGQSIASVASLQTTAA